MCTIVCRHMCDCAVCFLPPVGLLCALRRVCCDIRGLSSSPKPAPPAIERPAAPESSGTQVTAPSQERAQRGMNVFSLGSGGWQELSSLTALGALEGQDRAAEHKQLARGSTQPHRAPGGPPANMSYTGDYVLSVRTPSDDLLLPLRWLQRKEAGGGWGGGGRKETESSGRGLGLQWRRGEGRA